MTNHSESENWNPLEVAYEIVDISTIYTEPTQALPTYKNGGTNSISEEAWNAGYEPPRPYIRNTTRNLQFNESIFLASPGEPLGTTSYITTSDGYTWAAMSSAINAMYPYDPSDYAGVRPPISNAYSAGNQVITPPEGVVKVTANYKGQRLKFFANENGVDPGTPDAVPLERYFVTDIWGNEYVMHASGKEEPSEVKGAFEAAVLPDGWLKSTRTLSEDLILDPAASSDGSFHYLVLRDSADNSYHQMGWGSGINLASRVAGMPIWGGQSNDILSDSEFGNDLVRGAGGDDRIASSGGNDLFWGDAGNDSLIGSAGDDTFWGNEGNDYLDANEGNDLLNGHQGNDSVLGGAGNDLLMGGKENDTLAGSNGNDSLSGDKGDDILQGTLSGLLLEKDTLTGGAGNDIFVLGDENAVYYQGDLNDGYAIIADLSPGDLIQLRGSPDDYILIENLDLAGNSALDTAIATASGDIIGVLPDTIGSIGDLNSSFLLYV